MSDGCSLAVQRSMMLRGILDECSVSTSISLNSKRAEDALKESEQRFHSTLDNMIEGCQIIGRDWRYIYINEAAEKQNQRPMEELLGNRYMDMWPGIESTNVFIVLRRCMEEKISRKWRTSSPFQVEPSGGSN